MTRRHLRLTFPESQVTEPIIYRMVKDFDVIPSIRRASIENHFGWMIIELSGSSVALDAAESWLGTMGVDVTSAEGDVIAG